MSGTRRGGRREGKRPDAQAGGVDLSVEVGSLRLANPILLASGTVGYGEEIARLIDLDRIGGIVVKGLSLEPHPGNPPPRIAETPAGMLNSIGLQNIGVEAFVRDKLPLLRRHRLAVIANIWGRTVAEYAAVAARLDAVEGIDALELNISCPNIEEGGIGFGKDPRATYEVTAAVRQATGKPLWVKLAPGVTDVCEIARAADDAGADALCAINTIRGMLIDVDRRRPLLATGVGGLSGPALFPLALRVAHEVSVCTAKPVIGIGGINDLRHVLQFMIAGCCAVQIGTANFYDPTISQRLVVELERWCEREGIPAVRELVGTLEAGP